MNTVSAVASRAITTHVINQSREVATKVGTLCHDDCSLNFSIQEVEASKNVLACGVYIVPRTGLVHPGCKQLQKRTRASCMLVCRQQEYEQQRHERRDNARDI
jgi:hypothetical protein